MILFTAFGTNCKSDYRALQVQFVTLRRKINFLTKKLSNRGASKRRRQTKRFVTQLNWIRNNINRACLLYTSPSPRDGLLSRMPSSA